MRKALLLNFVIIVLQVSSTAQENNYWSIQYGTRSTLLGGAVIGSVSDLSATFYNPCRYDYMNLRRGIYLYI